ncbi:hypothetical protein HK096_001570 [Nowakowskiella sp. JEL0078]|nr:hypothetical protein HK096_001570 [Nowakowskiella sp. JEL0078]
MKPDLKESSFQYPVADLPDIFGSVSDVSESQVIVATDCNSINTGSVLFRNSPWSRSLLQRMWNLRLQSKKAVQNIDIWWEQAALIWVFEYGREGWYYYPGEIEQKRIEVWMGLVDQGREKADNEFMNENITKVMISNQEFRKIFENQIKSVFQRRKLPYLWDDFRDEVDNSVKSKFVMVPVKWLQALSYESPKCNDNTWRADDFVVHFPGFVKNFKFLS